jgi:hypothetical protein
MPGAESVEEFQLLQLWKSGQRHMPIHTSKEEEKFKIISSLFFLFLGWLVYVETLWYAHSTPITHLSYRYSPLETVLSLPTGISWDTN